MVKPKAPEQMQRPRRRFGDVIREIVGCPICRREPGSAGYVPLRVVAYRSNTIRLECPVCELRFSVDHHNLVEAINRSGFRAAMANGIYTRHEDGPLTDSGP
jgi:transcription elongation factor Elf1